MRKITPRLRNFSEAFFYFPQHFLYFLPLPSAVAKAMAGLRFFIITLLLPATTVFVFFRSSVFFGRSARTRVIPADFGLNVSGMTGRNISLRSRWRQLDFINQLGKIRLNG